MGMGPPGTCPSHQALTVHLVLMAWVGQKSLHFRQVQQRCIRIAMTVWSTRPKTPMEHLSMQVPHSQQRRLSMYTSMAMVPGAQISTFHHTFPLAGPAGPRAGPSPEGIIYIAIFSL
jgi:hypothetical protein